jgi:DNA repair protein RadC
MNPYIQSRQDLFGKDVRGLDDLSLLTTLLSYTEPSDPKGLAEKLLSEKGSLKKVFLTEEQALLELGASANTASMIRMLLPAFGRALSSEFSPKEAFDSTSKLGEYFARRFLGIGTEAVYLLLLHEDLTAIGCYRVALGSINSANFNIRAVVEMALFKGATYVAVAHNHPGGSPQPSSADKTTTLNLQTALGSVGIGLLDHIVVADNRYVPILLNSHGIFREETYHM